uniref:Hemopexin n=1 Tax=Falco tinnunculus TaxID=100819 RepID=A0A8C4TZT7_FALTI
MVPDPPAAPPALGRPLGDSVFPTPPHGRLAPGPTLPHGGFCPGGLPPGLASQGSWGWCPWGSPCGAHPVGHLQGEQVWAYAGGQLRPGFPRRVADEFPGVPGGLDAAVECHPEECGGESILFFKGDTVYAFDLELRVTKPRTWPGLGPCTAALRWLERYYCLRGTRFQRFDPRTGEVPPGYPRDLRDYFIPCPGRGEHLATPMERRASWGPPPHGVLSSSCLDAQPHSGRGVPDPHPSACPGVWPHCQC